MIGPDIYNEIEPNFADNVFNNGLVLFFFFDGYMIW